jgi:peptidyl-prolyl cis-trans isomerase C
MRKDNKNDCLFMVVTIFLTAICFVSFSGCSSEARKESETNDRKISSEAKMESESKDRKIVARVNGESIYEDQLDPLVEKELGKFKKYSKRTDYAELTERLQKRALYKVIGQELLYQESRRLLIPDMEEKIQERINAMKSKYHEEKYFEDMLKAKKLTMNDLKRSMKKRILMDEYLRSVGIVSPEVPEEQIKDFYEQNIGSFKRGEAYVRASHILIKVSGDAGNEEKEQARKKAEMIRKEIVGGRDFGEMAKEYSEDGHAPKGGDLGFIKRGYMPPEFDEVAFTLEKDRISDVVQTEHGYHIILVVDKKSEGMASYEEVKDFIGKYLQEELTKKKLASHIEALREKAKIEILLNES